MSIQNPTPDELAGIAAAGELDQQFFTDNPQRRYRVRPAIDGEFFDLLKARSDGTAIAVIENVPPSRRIRWPIVLKQPLLDWQNSDEAALRLVKANKTPAHLDLMQFLVRGVHQ